MRSALSIVEDNSFVRFPPLPVPFALHLSEFKRRFFPGLGGTGETRVGVPPWAHVEADLARVQGDAPPQASAVVEPAAAYPTLPVSVPTTTVVDDPQPSSSDGDSGGSCRRMRSAERRRHGRVSLRLAMCRIPFCSLVLLQWGRLRDVEKAYCGLEVISFVCWAGGCELVSPFGLEELLLLPTPPKSSPVCVLTSLLDNYHI